MPWDQQEGEPNRWFQRFNVFRLLGPARSVLATANAERSRLGKQTKNAVSHHWQEAAKTWQWRKRAEAWDRYLIDQAQDEIEAKWREQIMGEVELLARLSQMARGSIDDFVVIGTDGHIENINRAKLNKQGHLVKKISSSKGRTESIGIELHDPQGAMQMLGKHLKLFTESDRDRAETSISNFMLPADVIAPQFLATYRDIRDHRHTEYVLYGGRGSTKSSFASLVIIYLLVNNPQMHTLALRQVADTLRDSVYSQITWAISELGLSDKFKATVSPMEITYLPTGQKIYFRGADNPEKIKSIKPPFGSISILWFEETSEFHGEEAIRNITQSAIRGTDLAYIFKTYNPPRTSGNWINKYVLIPKDTQYQHRSDYRTVPVEWLGQVFIDEAEHLKEVNPDAYNHEYLGEVNGLGDQVFTNVQLRKITDEEISQFDHVLHGLDFGFYPHPAHYSRCHYDAARLTLYIFGEMRKWKTSNRDMYDALVEYGLLPDDLLICDSEDPKSIADYREYGASARGAEKGPGSRKYSMKWLQSLKTIIIDPERCPHTATEFTDYAYLRTKDGEIIEDYPDEGDDAISATRYSTNLIWRRRGQ